MLQECTQKKGFLIFYMARPEMLGSLCQSYSSYKKFDTVYKYVKGPLVGTLAGTALALEGVAVVVAEEEEAAAVVAYKLEAEGAEEAPVEAGTQSAETPGIFNFFLIIIMSYQTY